MLVKWLLVGIACLTVLGVVADVIGPREEDVTPENSIFRSREAEERLMEIYDELLARWPVPYEELDLATSYGTVHVIVSGPENAEPAFLLHASGMSATSWAWNVEALANYRTYAIDHIGEVNKSRLADVDRFPKTPEEISGLYAEIAALLGVVRSVLVAGSNGGYVAMTYAIRYPERVSALILTGPMGLSPPKMQMGLRLLAAQFIHLRRVEQRTLDWVLGTSAAVREPFGEWFSLMMRGSFPHVVPPKGIPAEQLATIEVPVLLFLGTADNLVGSAARASEAASVMPHIEIKIVNSSHLVNVEAADEVNRGIAEFLAE